MRSVAVRAYAAWLVLIFAESVHGTLRELLLTPYVGDLRARQIGVLTGSVIVLGAAYGLIHWIRADTPRSRWLVGLLWVALTLSFELSLGRLVLGYSWSRVLEDYDVTRGGFLSLGMLVLLLSPHIASKAREPRPPATAGSSIVGSTRWVGALERPPAADVRPKPRGGTPPGTRTRQRIVHRRLAPTVLRTMRE